MARVVPETKRRDLSRLCNTHFGDLGHAVSSCQATCACGWVLDASEQHQNQTLGSVDVVDPLAILVNLPCRTPWEPEIVVWQSVILTSTTDGRRYLT